ncbi:hypothetical protein GO986_11805 [Deinococcus sp. HMF7620]|uniref:Uncharacterized protein n=1 Tax=Deinococcus arboris TaxID=2682977 RepID=A0A7C9HS59_9DEIO|nr:hypothetical protein [Deinococcus arboris]MVN87453.1 hypothetical protein [Deinococcus arboris]
MHRRRPKTAALAQISEVAVDVPQRWHWLTRLNFALRVLLPPIQQPPNPRRMKRLGDLPPELQGVKWPPGVTPLGVYRSRRDERVALLHLPADDFPARAQLFREVQAALVASGLPPAEAGSGFAQFPPLYTLNPEWLLHVMPPWSTGPLGLSLFRAAHYTADLGPGLNLTCPTGLHWSNENSESTVLLASGSNIHAAFAHWLTEAAGQGWITGAPLFGDGLSAARLDAPGRTVLLQAVLFSLPWGQCWAVQLDRGFFDQLARQTLHLPTSEPHWTG